jgi:hypothetical protein
MRMGKGMEEGEHDEVEKKEEMHKKTAQLGLEKNIWGYLKSNGKGRRGRRMRRKRMCNPFRTDSKY